MTLNILLPNQTRSKWDQPTAFLNLFEWNESSDLLAQSFFTPQFDSNSVFAVNLNNQGRLSPGLASPIAETGPCVYDYMTSESWHLLANADVPVLLDMSLEALACRDNIYEGLIEGAKYSGIPLNRLFITTSNLRAAQAFQARYFGSLQNAPTILSIDACLLLLAGFNRRTPLNTQQLSDRLDGVSASRFSLRKFTFTSFNGRSRPHRFYLLLRMFSDGLFSDSAVSFLGYSRKPLSDDMLLDRFAKFQFPVTDDLIAALPAFHKSLPLEMDVSLDSSSRDNAYKTTLPWLSPSPHIYDQSYFSVVIDTTLKSSDMLFLTPIAFKSLMNLSPFVYFGNHGALQRMRDLGFVTFGSIIDESYDLIEDDSARLESAYSEVLRLGKLPRQQLMEAYNSVFDALVHNYNHFYDYSSKHARSQLLTSIVQPLQSALNS